MDGMVNKNRWGIIEILHIPAKHKQHEKLSTRKLSARWVPFLLTVEQNRNRSLAMFKRNPKQFLQGLVSIDEAWIDQYMPEMKAPLIQWIPPGKTAPKNARLIPSTGEITATIFWDF